MIGKAGSISLACFATSQPSDPARQIDIGHKRAIFALAPFEQGDRFFAGRRDSGLKPSVCQSVFNDDLNWWVVFDNQDNR